MRWFKVATVALGLLIVFLVVSSVIGFLIEAVIAVLVVAVIALGIKAAFYKKQISGKRLIGRSATRVQQFAAPSEDAECRRRAGPAEARDG